MLSAPALLGAALTHYAYTVWQKPFTQVLPGELQHSAPPPKPQTCSLGQQMEPKSGRLISVVPLGQTLLSHWQVEQLRLRCPSKQLTTQLPPQSVVPKK